MRRRSVLTGLAAAGLGLAAPHVARAAPRVLRMGHSLPLDSSYEAVCQAMAKAVAAHPVLAGAFSIHVQGDGALGEQLALVRNVISNSADLALVACVSAASVVDQAGLLNAPFVFGSVERARQALDGAVGEEFAAILAARGLVVLGWGENGMRHMTANRPIRTPADLVGLKMRVPPSPVISGGLAMLGVNPKPLGMAQLRDALRTGEFDAQENPVQVIEGFKLHDLQKYLSLTGHVYDPVMLVACTDLIEDLTPPQRAAMTECAQAAAGLTRRIAQDAQTNGLARLQALGMTVVQDVDIAAFRVGLRPYLTTLGQTYGAGLMERLMAG